MNIAAIAFTQKGLELAWDLAHSLEEQGDSVSVAAGFGEHKQSHRAWTEKNFHSCDALVFVGACGIAVRSIAPHLKSKASDPAVLVLDEGAGFCIPLVSGHIGGANLLASRVSRICGATPVITTATDVEGVFAFDAWAVQSGMAVANPPMIKKVSAALLKGKSVSCFSDVEIGGIPPKGVLLTDKPECVDVSISMRKDARGLRLVPRLAVLGIGCRRGTERERIDSAAKRFLAERDIDILALGLIASIDLKADEKGLVGFADAHELPFKTYSSEELNSQEGNFTASGFVSEVTGTDNVCERSVVAAGADLLYKKTVVDGVTLALGARKSDISWQKG